MCLKIVLFSKITTIMNYRYRQDIAKSLYQKLFSFHAWHSYFNFIVICRLFNIYRKNIPVSFGKMFCFLLKIIFFKQGNIFTRVNRQMGCM